MFLVMLLACSTEPPICESEKLFGVPSESTGLSGDQCAPTCSDCGGEPDPDAPPRGRGGPSLR